MQIQLDDYASAVLESVSAGEKVMVSTVMSSSCPNRWAARAISSADWVEMAAARSKPKSSPVADWASTTPSDRKVSELAGRRRKLVSSYLMAESMPRGSAVVTGA